MSVAETFNPSSINLSARAVKKVQDLVTEEENDELKLRVFITGGGCSGFQYGFTFDELVSEDDTAIEKDGVTVLIDPMSFQYLTGSEVDYTEGLEGSRFVITNPNATTTCTGGAITAPANGATFSYTGGTVNASASCTVKLNILRDNQHRLCAYHPCPV